MLKGQKIRQIFQLKLKTALKRIEIFVYKDIFVCVHDGSGNDDKHNVDDDDGNEEDVAKDKEIH